MPRYARSMQHAQPSDLASSAPFATSRQWRTVVHNDPVNLMTYVEWVFTSYFGMDQRAARATMLKVHNNGRAVVSRGSREAMEADAQAMHTYGLWATIEEDDR